MHLREKKKLVTERKLGAKYGTELEHDMELENSVMGINFPTQFHFSLF